MKEYYTRRDAQRAALKEVMKDWSLPEMQRAVYLVTDIMYEMGIPEASVIDAAKKRVKVALVENTLNGNERENSAYSTDDITVTVKNYYTMSRSYELRIRGLIDGNERMMDMDSEANEYDDPEEWLYTEIDVPANYDTDVRKALENLDYSGISGVVIHRE